MAHTPGQVPLPPGFKIVRPTKDHFTPQPAPARLAAQRSWPNIQGSRAVLDEAIEHLEAVAARFGIRLVWQDPDERGQAGSQKIGSNSITFARELEDHPALYAWVLAHELGHAFDPRLQVMGRSEYGTRVHTDDYELVAEAVALRDPEVVGFHNRQRCGPPQRGGRQELAKTSREVLYPQSLRDRGRCASQAAPVGQLRSPKSPSGGA